MIWGECGCCCGGGGGCEYEVEGCGWSLKNREGDELVVVEVGV